MTRRHYIAARSSILLAILALLLSLVACSEQASRAPEPTPADTVVPTSPAMALAQKGDPVPGDPIPPTPTVPPQDWTPRQLLQLALDQQRSGEPRAMAATLIELLERDMDAAGRRQATFYLAQSDLLLGQPEAAVTRLEQVRSAGPRDLWGARAQFMLGRAYEQTGAHREAALAYRAYRELGAPLSAYAAQREAAQWLAIGDTESALEAYEFAAAQPIAGPTRASILEDLIRIRGEQGRDDLRLARLEDLLTFAKKPEYRPGVLLRAATAAEALQDRDKQLGFLRQIIADHPEAPEALVAIGELEQSGAPPVSLVAGKTSFEHQQYASALAHLEAALATELSPDERFEARRLHGLALQAQGSFDQALAELGALAQEGDGPAHRQSELDYIQTVGQSGNRGWAIEGYRRFAAEYPEDPLAPEALWRAIQLQVGEDIDAAMEAALDLGRLFRNSEQAHLALDQAARYFRSEDQLPEAIRAWQLLGEGARGWTAAEARFWAGMTLIEGGERDAGLQEFRLAIDAAPESYYAARAREFLGRLPQASAPPGAAISPLERIAVEDWIATWTGRPVVRVDDGWLPAIRDSAEVHRARELGVLDLGDEAREEWLQALEQWADAPEQLWQLGLLASLEHRSHEAMRIAERLVARSPSGRIAPDTPVGLLKLLFPAPYARLVQQEARSFSIDPRLLYAVMRQESRFRPEATSWVGARGLTQVMPSTAAGIAEALRSQDFDPDQLYSPAVAIRFGAFYLGNQMQSFDGNIQAAAAAYNGGPGNAERWLAQSSHPDRFTELIDFRETREYVKVVYGNWGMYRMLYR